ncbi:hypothetical protein [Chryseobacterium sp. SIMBA_029]|uniref:hypothetical protein n=1 Tax=Chryseobacterium sp. SIMBA_029 TaxID=3085772 RepID=UPI00397BF789
MKKQQLNALLSIKNEVLSRAQMKNIIGGKLPGEGGPGGNNGNPCPELCEPVGGYIFCLNQVTNTISPGNCAGLPNYDPNNHNLCMNEATGNFWC